MAESFTPETLRFLRGLIENNDRTWFEERRPIYERALRAPLLALVETVNASLEEFAPEHVRPAHKIAMRIFRDTRFSPDKRPYKHHLSAWWARRGLEKRGGAGFYVQIGPKESFVAAGVYAPERDDLLALRRWLAENHPRYRGVLAPLLKPRGKTPAMDVIAPNALTRNPKSFAPDHPASDLLRARNWGVTAPLAADAVLSPDLAKTIVHQLRRAATLVDVLNEPLLAAATTEPSRALF